MTKHNQTIGQRLTKLRQEQNLTPEDVCQACGWDDVSTNAQKTRIARYEQDKRQPGIDDIVLLANALGTTFMYIAFGDKADQQTADITSDHIQHLPITNVMPDPEQPRKEFDQDGLQQLTASIKEHGVIQPITVRQPTTNGPYTIVCGERRYRASKLAGQATVPAIVNNNIKDQDLFAVQIIENLQRQDLSLAETAKGVHRLRQKFSLEETAEKLGRSTSWVSRRANIPDMPPHVWQAVQNGHIGDANMATDLANLHQLDPETAQNITTRLAGESTGNEWMDNYMQPETLTRASVADHLKTAKLQAEAAKKREQLAASQQGEETNKQAEETPEQAAAKKQQDADYAAQQKAQQAKDQARAELIKQLKDTIVYANGQNPTINTNVQDQSWRKNPEDIYIGIDFFTNATAAPFVREWLNNSLPQLADLLIKNQTPSEK